MTRLLFAAVAIGSIVLLSACSQSDSGSSGTPAPTSSSAPRAAAGDPKSAISQQLDALKAGDVDKVKAGMTARVRDAVTAEVVAKAKEEAGKMTIDELVDSLDMSEIGGKRAARIKMKNGNTLTTLIEEDGKWLADTVWFK